MATQTNNPRFEETTERLVDYNEKVLEVGRRLAGSTIDSYERAAFTVADLQEKVADASRVEWVTTVASAQAGLTRELTKAYTKAARELLAV